MSVIKLVIKLQRKRDLFQVADVLTGVWGRVAARKSQIPFSVLLPAIIVLVTTFIHATDSARNPVSSVREKIRVQGK